MYTLMNVTELSEEFSKNKELMREQISKKPYLFPRLGK